MISSARQIAEVAVLSHKVESYGYTLGSHRHVFVAVSVVIEAERFYNSRPAEEGDNKYSFVIIAPFRDSIYWSLGCVAW
jgi:hypothetical protein